MFNWIKNIYNKVWNWAKNSGTILVARLQTISGVLIGAIGAIDWTALLSYSIEPSYNWKNAAILGGTLALQGIIIELVRRANTVEVNNRLMPAEATKTEIKAVEVKK